MHTNINRIDRLLGGLKTVSLLIIIVFELVMIISNFLLISPNILEKIGFVGLGIFIVLFKVDARLANNFKLWFIGAVLTFYVFFNFFLTICLIGLPIIQIDSVTEVPDYLMRAQANYAEASNTYAQLTANQADAGAEYRTYMKDLTGPIAEARATKEAAEQALAKAEARHKDEGLSETEQFSGLRVFSTVPLMILTIADENTSAVTRIALIVAILFGVAAGMFIEFSVVAAVNKSNKKLETIDIPAESVIVSEPISKIAAKVTVTEPNARLFFYTAWPNTGRMVKTVEQIQDQTMWPLKVIKKYWSQFFEEAPKEKLKTGWLMQQTRAEFSEGLKYEN